MKIIKLNPKKSLNKAFLKQRPLRSEIELFKVNLIRLLGKIDEIEREENQKNHIRDFLRDTYYRNTNEINTKDTKDLVIHLGKTNKDKVGVIIEAKRPGNKSEMLTESKPNAKAFQELVLYYLRERIEENNIDIKYLVATNVYEWYIFEASYFERSFFKNKLFVKQYEQWRDGQKVTKDTNLFYNSIAKPFIDIIEDEIPCTYFDIRDYDKVLRNEDKADDKNLIALQKLLSPYFLLKESFTNDSNSLNERFYKELLHIIGLEEVKEGTRNIIRRKEKDKQAGSLIENTINILITEDTLYKVKDKSVFGKTKDEQLFGIALELSLTWINRILFLKLLEGQLISYHKGSKDYRFLNSEMIQDFDELYKLFHQVLARNIDERTSAIQQKYSSVPYLNSSLFEISELEDLTIKINSLDDSERVELIGTTVLKDEKRKNASLSALEYLFRFLDAYDFASEGGEDIAEDSKTIINASVLGKVFEKINGYKDGSIFTPGFITMYMSRQSVRLAVIQKFNEYFTSKKIEEIVTFEELYNRIDRIDVRTANEIVNSLRICDPAVGSGHFLVSCLNELIVIKSELGILVDKSGKRLRDYEIVVENDELIISDENGIFEYNYQNKENQRVQETIFNERQSIIENCLFGVDINPNSVKICRLRLWIELLKSSYYKAPNFTELETLPNIDINIKCGNSLISRFALDADLKKALQRSKWNITSYRLAVMTYRNAKSKDEKRAMEDLILRIKQDFTSEIRQNDPLKTRLDKLANELYNRFTGNFLFEPETSYNRKDAELAKKRRKEHEKIEKEINELTHKIEEIKSNTIYKNAFEWRFEFPEVLDDNGDFVGFDVVIGNPPYGIIIENQNIDILRNTLSLWNSTILQDSYYGFISLGLNISNTAGQLSYIIPNTWRLIKSAKKFRDELVSAGGLYKIDTYLKPVFDGVVVDCDIIFNNKKNKSNKINLNINSYDTIIKSNDIPKSILLNQVSINSHLGLSEYKLVDKINANCKKLNEILLIKNGVKPYEIGKGYPKQTKATLDEKPFTKNIKIDSTFLPLIGGSDFHKYIVKWDNNSYISYGPWLAAPRDKCIFEAKEKIIVRQTSDRLIATIIPESYIMRNNTHIILTKNIDFSLKYILALINSLLFDFIYWTINPERGEVLAEVKAIHLDQLPIKEIEQSKQQPFIDLVDQILAAKQQGKDTKDFEKLVDQMVYKLYDLTEEEIKIVEGNGK